MHYMWFWYIKICRRRWDSNPRQTPLNLKRVVVLLARLPGEGRQIITISQSFREDSIVGRCDIFAEIEWSIKIDEHHDEYEEINNINHVFFRRLGVWQSFLLLPKLSIPQKVVSNKQVIIIINRIIIMIYRTIDIIKNLQTGQHDSELSEDF